MKKLFAISLALFMALGMTSVAFATPVYTIDSTGYDLENGIILIGTSEAVHSGDTVNPGQTLYYAILADGAKISDSDMVKGVTIKQTWDMGKDYVQSISVAKKKYTNGGTSDYYYFVAVTYKTSTSTSSYDVVGEITLKKTTTTNTVGVPFTATLAINNPYAFDKADDFVITDETMLYDFTSTGDLGNGSAVTGDQTFSIIGDHYFDVDVTGQGKLLLYADLTFNATVAAAYPAANLDFVNFKGGSFNKTGELTILADEGSYLYVLNADGTLSKAKAKYDEYEEAFKLTTRTLGRYVISDTELKLTAASSSSTIVSSSTAASSSTVVSSSTAAAPTGSTTAGTVKTNPPTGAAV